MDGEVRKEGDTIPEGDMLSDSSWQTTLHCMHACACACPKSRIQQRKQEREAVMQRRWRMRKGVMKLMNVKIKLFRL